MKEARKNDHSSDANKMKRKMAREEKERARAEEL